jgi:hypothetical protein
MATGRHFRAVCALAGVVLTVTIGLAPANAQSGKPRTDRGDDSTGKHSVASGDVYAQLAEVRLLTEKYRDIKVAIADGYQPTNFCMSIAEGAMGYHYARRNDVDDKLDIDHPEFMLYVPTRQGLTLGAVEYMKPDADQDLATDYDRPSLFGQPFDGPMEPHEPWQRRHYDLHVWLGQYNPDGMFARYNPRFACPTVTGDSNPFPG